MQRNVNRRLLPDRQGDQARAINLVVPLAPARGATDMRIRDTAGRSPGRSRAVSPLIEDILRPGDLTSTNDRRTPRIRSTPGTRASTTATRTTTGRPTTTGRARSADYSDDGHAGISFGELVAAYFDCRRTKRNSATALAFEQDLERNLRQLYDQLNEDTWRPGRSICFVITRPRAREVWAAPFRDRIVHHALYNRVAPRFHAAFVADTCACIPGRGTLYAVHRLEQHARSLTQAWARPAYYLKCDLASFFVSIDKRILMQALARRIPEPWWLRLTATVLLHDPRVDVALQSDPARLALIPPHKSLFGQPWYLGLPIGNLSSQFFANVHLDALDQFIKHEIRSRHYVRYVDDFVLLHESPQWLNAARDRIAAFLEARLRLRLNDRKTVLQPIGRGIDFAGQFVKPFHTTLRRRTYNDAIARTAAIDAGDLFETANSYFGLLRQASHSHYDRARLANVLRRRGHSVNRALTQTYRRRA